MVFPVTSHHLGGQGHAARVADENFECGMHANAQRIQDVVGLQVVRGRHETHSG